MEEFIDACKNGDVETVKCFLADYTFDPSTDKNLAIQKASIMGHVEVVRLLLTDSRVNPTDRNDSAIRWASYTGHTEVVKLLLQDPRVDPSKVETQYSELQELLAQWKYHPSRN